MLPYLVQGLHCGENSALPWWECFGNIDDTSCGLLRRDSSLRPSLTLALLSLIGDKVLQQYTERMGSFNQIR